MHQTIGLALVILLCVAAISGCETIAITAPASPKQVDQLIANDEYGAALASLRSVPKTAPDYPVWQRKLEAVEKLAAEFEVDTIREAMTLQEDDKWAEALAVYDQALAKYPQSTSLVRGRNRLVRERDGYIRELDAEATMTHAANLLAELKLREKSVEIAPNELAGQWELERLRQDIHHTTQKLIICASNSAPTNPALADRCLQQARAMGPDAQHLEQIVALEEWLKEKPPPGSRGKAAMKASQSAGRRSRQAVPPGAASDPASSSGVGSNLVTESQISELNEQATAFIDQRKLVEARQTIATLLVVAPDDAQVGAVNARLQAAIAREVQAKINQGRELYRQERIAQAKVVWEEGLELDPDNEELNALVQRAERVLKKVEELREMK